MEGNVKLMKPKTLHRSLFHCLVVVNIRLIKKSQSMTTVTSILISTRKGRETVRIWIQQLPHHVHVVVCLVKPFC